VLAVDGSARSDKDLGHNAVNKMLVGHASCSRYPTGDDHASSQRPAAETASSYRWEDKIDIVSNGSCSVT
jgi:hypothetical protein